MLQPYLQRTYGQDMQRYELPMPMDVFLADGQRMATLVSRMVEQGSMVLVQIAFTTAAPLAVPIRAAYQRHVPG